MSRLMFLFALALCFCADAMSETVAIGNVSIAYTVPVGFVRAEKLFSPNLKEMDKAFKVDTVVFAVFVPEADFKIRQNDRRAVPHWYVHLAYDNFFSKHSIDRASFAAITWLVENGIAQQYDSAGFIKKLDAVISGTLNRKLKIRSMTQKGIVEDKPRYRSMLAYGRGVLEGDSGSEEIELATLTTFFLDQGKLVTILQASRIESEKDLPAFTEKALRLAAEITARKN